MKRYLVFVTLFALLTGCQSQPPYVDNGNPGQIKAIVFMDANQNGVMDAGEAGLPAQVSISQEISCPPTAQPKRVDTDAAGVHVFKDLKPGKYCVIQFSDYTITSKMTQEVYVSSDTVVTVMWAATKP
jgi:uncharacterized protein (DUF2141 family)